MEASVEVQVGLVIIDVIALLLFFKFIYPPPRHGSKETRVAASVTHWMEAEVVYKGYTPYGLSEADGDPILGIKYSDNIYYINTKNTPEAAKLSIGQKIEIKIERQRTAFYLEMREPEIYTDIYCRVPVEDCDGKYCVLLSRHIESTHDLGRWHYKYFCDLLYDGVIYTYLIPENLYKSLPCDEFVFYKNGKLNGYDVGYVSKRKACIDIFDKERL